MLQKKQKRSFINQKTKYEIKNLYVLKDEPFVPTVNNKSKNVIEVDDINQDSNDFFKNTLIRLLHCITNLALVLTMGVLIAFYVLWRFGRDIPDYYFLQNYRPSSITNIYDRFGNKIKEFAEERRLYVHISDIPSKLIHAFISAEDKNFYNHLGIDLKSLIKAVILNTAKDRWKKNPVGASTITQQVAKIFLVGNERSLERKIKEAILSFRLENALTKDRIIELYLNEIYLGASSYGVFIAAKTYFNKRLTDLTNAECALLASLPKAPSAHDPFKNPKKAIERRNWILKKMYEQSAITLVEYETAIAEPLSIAKTARIDCFENSFFLEDVRRELIKNYGEKKTYNFGIEATITLNPEMQKLLDDSLRYGLEKYDKQQNWHGTITKISTDNWKEELKKISIPSDIDAKAVVILKHFKDEKKIKIGFQNGCTSFIKWSNIGYKISSDEHKTKLKVGDVILVREVLDGAENIENKEANGKYKKYELFQIPEATGGAVALDAKTGEVLAMSGGYSFELTQFNCATQALRQPGSAFKPFVYLTALERGFKSSSTLNEAPVSFPIAGGFYTPHNYNKESYGGRMSLYSGLTRSRNVFTVILANKVGVSRIARLAERLGISDYVPNDLTVALGSTETTVLKLASAYAIFFNGGYAVKPNFFLNITSHLDVEGFNNEKNPDEKIVSDSSVKQMREMLSGVITHGTGKSINYLTQKFPIKIFGKTGTSSDFKDAWFVCGVESTGQNNDLLKYKNPIVIAVFVGHFIPRNLGNNQTGSKVAIPVAERFIENICKKYEDKPIEQEKDDKEASKDKYT